MLLNVVQIQTVAIILILSYFIGNFQTAVLYSKRFLHDDVRQHGSGNPGASPRVPVMPDLPQKAGSPGTAPRGTLTPAAGGLGELS